jgi:hypothetical protein
MVRTLADPDCVRPCVHYFSLESEIDQLVEGIQKFASKDFDPLKWKPLDQFYMWQSQITGLVMLPALHLWRQQFSSYVQKFC